MIFSRAKKTRVPRTSVQQSAWLVYAGSFAARPCTVNDLSDTGAKITADEPSSVGSRLRLAFSRDVRTGRQCEVVWQRGKTFGVRFV